MAVAPEQQPEGNGRLPRENDERFAIDHEKRDVRLTTAEAMAQNRGALGSLVRRAVSRRRLLDLLRELTETPGAVAETVYLPPAGPPPREWEDLPPSAAASAGGLVLLSGPGLRIAIAPPFAPDADDGLSVTAGRSERGPVLGPLRSALTRPRLVGVVLVRLGAYAVGVVDDGRLVASKTGTRYVGRRHRAGGQSQRRFERGREGQVVRLYDRVCTEARTRFGPYAGRLNALALGGERHVVRGFLERCPEVSTLSARLPTVRISVRRPGLEALQRACTSIWTSTVWAPEAIHPRTRSL